MADTSCAGANWRVVEPTGHTCDVYAYNERYDAIKDVPIATCATVVPGDNGLDFLLIGHEMLYFGTDMKRSLLNQNQIRHHIHQDGGVIQDDFTRGATLGSGPVRLTCHSIWMDRPFLLTPGLPATWKWRHCPELLSRPRSHGIPNRTHCVYRVCRTRTCPCYQGHARRTQSYKA